jgi:hypothetical protein
MAGMQKDRTNEEEAVEIGSMPVDQAFRLSSIGATRNFSPLTLPEFVAGDDREAQMARQESSSAVLLQPPGGRING